MAEAIGRQKTAQIYYRILEASYLTAHSQFIDCRLAAERAAHDLFGDGSPEVEAVLRAYDAVGIIAAEPTTPLGDSVVGLGASWVATIAPDDNSLWLVKPTPEAGEGWEYKVQLTATPVLAATGHAITAPVNGDFLLFGDGDHNLRYIRMDGSAEEVINADGDWHSIALSPDGRRLVATTVDCRLLYERIDERSGRSEISVMDLCTGQEGVLYVIDQAPTFPGFINGDREIVFEEWTAADGGTVHLWRLPLAADGLSSLGEPLSFVPNSQAPKPIIVASDDIALATAVAEQAQTSQPAAFSLAQNYPNPFNAATLISYSVSSASRVILDIFNINGQRVAAVEQGLRSAGTHAVSWTGVDAAGQPLASGIYFYRLRLPDAERAVEQQTRKMLLLR